MDSFLIYPSFGEWLSANFSCSFVFTLELSPEVKKKLILNHWLYLITKEESRLTWEGVLDVYGQEPLERCIIVGHKVCGPVGAVDLL